MPAQDIEIIKKKLYKKLKDNITSSTISGFKRLVSKFIDEHQVQLYDSITGDNIYFTEEDRDAFFKLIKIDEKEIDGYIKETYYGKIEPFNPPAAKDAFTVVFLCFIRYLLLETKDKKILDLALVYYSFSGKYYASSFWNSYKKFPPSEYRHVMEYVISSQTSNKFGLKKEGSVFKAILALSNTWLEKYEKDGLFKTFTDEDIVYLIQQLKTRISSFIQNIASLYYDAIETKKDYLTYDSDNLDDDNYRLADNDSLLIERLTEAATNKIVSSSINIPRCKSAAQGKIPTNILKSILESIIDDSKNIALIRELINIIISEFFLNDKDKDVHSIRFISYSIAAKPNTKNPRILRQKEILETLVSENYDKYNTMKSRHINYTNALLYYVVLTIHSI